MNDDHWTIKQYKEHLAGGADLTLRKKKVSKYKNLDVWIDGFRFESLLEGAYYLQLCALQKAGEVAYFLMQVPMQCGGGVKYWVDFLVVRHISMAIDSNAGVDWIEYHDVKGIETRAFKNKKMQVESIYPIEIKLVKKDQIGAQFKSKAREWRQLGIRKGLKL